MNTVNLRHLAHELGQILEVVDRIRYTHSGMTKCDAAMKTGPATMALVKRLRDLKAAVLRSAVEQESGQKAAPPEPPPVSVSAPVPVAAASIPKELPMPKRKPGRPRKNPAPPAEAGGVA